MVRASISIMANIAEGFERGRLSEFHQFLSVSKASCAELRSHLYVALDAGYLTAKEFETLRAQGGRGGKDTRRAQTVRRAKTRRQLITTQHSVLSTQYL